MTFIDSNQMNSRKQVSNGCNETSMDDEQIRPVVSFSSRRSWMEPLRGILDWSRRTDNTAGNPGLVLEDGQALRRTEDENNTLGMTQKFSDSINAKVKGENQ